MILSRIKITCLRNGSSKLPVSVSLEETLDLLDPGLRILQSTNL